MKFLLALASLLLLPVAALHAEVRQTLDWQRIGFEERLQDRITRSITAASVAPGSFVVNVTLEMKAPGKSRRVAPLALSKEQVEAEASRVYLGKLETDAALIGSDDYIPSDGSGDRGAQEPGLFDSINQVRASVFLDKSISEGKKAIVESILRSSIGAIGAKPAEVKIERAELLAIPPAPLSVESWDLKRWVQEFKIPLGILLSTFCFGLLAITGGMVVFGGLKNIEARKVSLLEAKNAREEAAADAAAQERAVAASVANFVVDEKTVTTEQVEIGGAQKGFDRFRALLQETPERGGALVKQWLKDSGKGSSAALGALSQVLNGDELSVLFKQLSDNDRKEWKSVLATSAAPDPKLADSFVASQVVDSMLVPPANVDKELRQCLSELKLSDCVELAADDVEIGAVLAVLMPTAQVAQMFALIPAEQVNDITLRSLRLSSADIANKAAQLKATLVRRNSGRSIASPFIERASELLREVGAERESSIFGALAESGEYALLEAAARRHFPAELVFKLPPTLIKAALDRLPLARRADLIGSRQGDEREKLLNAVGAVDSKARDMLEVEVAAIQGDEVRVRRVAKGREKLLGQMLEGLRSMISGSEAAAELAEITLSEWLHEKTNGELGSRQDATHVA